MLKSSLILFLILRTTCLIMGKRVAFSDLLFFLAFLSALFASKLSLSAFFFDFPRELKLFEFLIYFYMLFYNLHENN